MNGGGRTESPVGIDRDLEMVSEGVAALRELAADPGKSEDSARVYDFSIRWGVLLSGRLKRLEHYYRAGELTGEHERGYRVLRLKLEEAIPEIDRLGIGRPTVPLKDQEPP